MTDAPIVSVIMAAYNGAALIGETIASVLAQSFADFELIVVDDRSTDETLAVLNGIGDARLRIVAADVNQGPVRTRNRAFALARGRYVAGLDQDDICLPDRFARQVAYLDAHPDTVLVGCAADLLEGGRVRPAPAPPRTSPAMLRCLIDVANPLVWSSVMIRADAARRLDPFTRPEILYAEDFDLYHRLAPMGAIARIDAPLLRYRIHPGGASKRFTLRMAESAVVVLSAAYAPIFGDDAAANAKLIACHFAGKQPVSDIDALRRAAAVLGQLLDHFARAHPLDEESRRLLSDEISRRWWRLVRTSIHAGRIGVREGLAVRPASSFVQAAPPRSGLLVSEMVGRARALRHRHGSARASADR